MYSFSQQHDLEDPAFSIFFDKNNIPQLDAKEKEACEELITIEEDKLALNNLGKNKSSGTDGWILSCLQSGITSDKILKTVLIIPSPKANWVRRRKEISLT